MLGVSVRLSLPGAVDMAHVGRFGQAARTGDPENVGDYDSGVRAAMTCSIAS